MQIKFVHDIMKRFDTNFDRNIAFQGPQLRTVYKYPSNVPYLNGKAVVTYYSNSAANIDKNDNVVYDYSALLTAETEEQVKHFEVTTYTISSLTVEKYEQIIRNNVVVSERMKQLRDEFALLAEIEKM